MCGIPGALFSGNRRGGGDRFLREKVMKNKKVACGVLILGFLIGIGCRQPLKETEKLVRDGIFPDFDLPGDTPVLFAPEFICTGMYERDIALSADGNELYFGVALGKIVTIMETRRVNGVWMEPQITSFARDLKYFYFEPCLSADGSRLLFLSTRPPAGKEPKPGWQHQNIWAVDRKEDGEWGLPYDLGSPINTDEGEYFPSLTREGTLYFTRSAAQGKPAVFRARAVNGKFGMPEKLPASVNGEGSPYNAFISADESMLVACVAGRKDCVTPGFADYYVFFRNENDDWSEGINLGKAVNPENENAVSASFSPDGKILFLASTRMPMPEMPIADSVMHYQLLKRHAAPQNGSADIYWMRADFIERLNPLK